MYQNQVEYEQWNILNEQRIYYKHATTNLRFSVGLAEAQVKPTILAYIACRYYTAEKFYFMYVKRYHV